MRVLAALLAFLLAPAAALAQGACPYLYQGNILTPAQWLYCFQQKQDALGYRAINANGDTMLGRLVTAAPGPTTAGFGLTPGSAPASPANGDLWATSSDLYAQVGGTTRWLTAQGPVRLSATAVNFGTSADTIITVALPAPNTRYLVTNISISHASASLTTATLGVNTASGGGGVQIASDQAVTVSSATDATANNAMALTINNSGTQSYTLAGQPRLYVRVGSTATGTADVTITLQPLP